MTIRTVLRLALSAILGTTTLAAAETTYLPGAAEVTGLAGARFSSTLEVSNPGATGTTVTIGLVPMAGKAAPASVTRTLAAGESLRVPEALKTLFGLSDGAAGTLTVTADEPLLANLTTRNVAAPEGAYGLGLLSVPSSDLLGAGETGHSIWVSQSADPATGYRTNLSVTLVDPGTEVEVRVFDAEGRVAGTATVTAATPEVWQQPVTVLTGAGTSLPVGRAEFEVKAGRATAFSVVNDNVTSDAIALQAERVVPGTTDRLISGAALSPGLLGSFWSTDLRLFNPGSVAVDATIQSVGASRESSAVVPVPAKGVVEVSRVLALLGLPEGTACALRAKASASLLVAARTNNIDPAGVRKGTFSAQQFVTSWPAGLLGAGAVGFFNGIDQTLNVPGARTNLTVVGGPEGAAGELVLRDAAGIERGRTGFLRGPGEWGQRGVADWFATAPTVPENARIDVSVATGALDAFVSRIDNASGDAVTRPVALPGGGDCSKVAVASFGAAPQPILPSVSTTFSWTVSLDPPSAELTSQTIRFDGEPEIELGKEIRSYTRSFASAGARSVTLTVRKGSCVKTRSLSFFVCGPLTLEPTTLPDGTAFAVYPTRMLTASGATAPTTFTVVAGELPEGLTLSPVGELSGRAEEVGVFTFTAQAVDANGCSGTREYSIRLTCPTLSIAPTSLPAGTVATPYSPVRFTVSGGSGTGTWSATGLPPGLALSTGGQLAGTPTTAGSYPVTVRFRDSSGCVGSTSYTIVICNTLVVGPSAVPPGTAGTPYGPVSFTAAGATGAATWAVTAGSLPAGVTLNGGTGVLSGTPTVVGTFPFTVTATDTLGCNGSAAVSLVVNCPTITVNPSTLVAAFEDAPYTATLTQTGGNAGATFTVVAGTLPAGLTLDPTTGVLSGVVAIPGNTSFTVRATDPVTACFGDRAYVFTVTPVNDAPSFVKGPDVGLLEDSGPYTAAWATAISAGPVDESGQVLTFNVTGNTNPALFSVAPSVSATGVLGFTPAPNASGTATITLTLSDDGGTANGGVDTSAAQTFVVTVTDVNDAPSFTKGPDVTVLEDAAAYSAAWATALSTGPAPEAGQTLTFSVTGNTNPALFSAVPAVSPAGVLAFTPAANANGTATITLVLSDNGGTANGGVDTSAAQTFVVNLTAVNDAPAFTKGADVTVLEDSGAHSTAGWATAILPGPVDESGQTVSFAVTGNTNAALFAVAPAISPAGGLTFTPAANASGTATVTLTLSDNGGTANGGIDTSAAQTFVINVTDVNDAPSFTKGADQTVLEDAGAQTVNPWATALSAGPPSESGQTLTFNVTNNTNPALFAVAPDVSPTGVLTYTPAANANGTATITLSISDNGGTANGGVNTSAAQTFVINVTAVNDVPSFTKGADQTVFEESGAQTVSPWATAIVTGPADEAGQTVSFAVTGNTNPALFAVAPAVSPTGVLTYTPAANASGTATITLTLSDSGGTANGGIDTSAAQTFVINVTDVNDAPSFTKGADQTVLEDAGAQTVNPWATALSAGPPSESGQTLTFNVTNNTNPALFAAVPAISATGVLTYTPAANANGTATITIQVQDDGGTANGGVNLSAAQTFVINVTAVNDAPSFTKGADQTVFDNAPAQTVAGWATAISKGPADEAGQTVSFNVTGNTNPGFFAVAPAIDPTGTLTYTPTPSSGGTATITITLSDNGGVANGGVDTSAAQTFDITFNHVNVAPSFTKGPDQTVLEDAGAQTVSPWATAISAGPPVEAGQTLTFNVTGNTNAALFAAGPAISATGVLTYTPAANANGTATITLTISDNGGTANGGVDTSAAQTFVINVTAVNDAPSFTKGADQTVFDNAPAQTVAGWATAISKGPADEAGQTVSFNVTGNTNPGFFAVAPAIDPTGTLTYTPTPSSGGTATITITLSDNGGVANGGVDTSAAQTFNITFNHVNAAPSFTKGPDQIVLEDAGAQTVSPWATAISAGPPVEAGQTLTFNVTGNTNAALFAAGPAISPTGVLTYTPAANANGSATITLTISDNGGTANGGIDTSAAQMFVITVNPVNDAPSFTKGADQSVNEDAAAQTVSPWATALSAGPTSEAAQTLTFNVTGNTNSSLFSAGPSVSPTGVLTYTPAANANGAATITLTISDNGGTANGGVDTSAPQSFVITINNVNDAPSFTKGADQTVFEDAGAQTVSPWATALSAGPPSESGQTLTFNVTNNTNTGLFSAGPAISSAGVLTYTPAANAFGTATITINLQDNGGTANGGIDTSASQTFVITVTAVNDPPIAGADAWDTIGNTELRVDLAAGTTPNVADATVTFNGVIANDADSVEGDPFVVTSVVGCPIGTPLACTLPSGAAVSMNANGTFSFTPPTSLANGAPTTTTFQYVITDSPAVGTPASATGTVTISVYDKVWYVKQGAVGGNGTSALPLGDFTTLNGAGGAGDSDAASDVVFVHNSGSLSGSIELEASQSLLGEGVGLSINRNLNGNGAPTNLVTAGTRPPVTSAADTIRVTAAWPAAIRGLALSSTGGNAIDVTTAAALTGATNLTIDSNSFNGTLLEGIDVNFNAGTSGTRALAISGNTFPTASTGNALDARTVAGNLELSVSGSWLSTANGILIDGSGGGSLTVTGFANNAIGGNTVGTGISVNAAKFDATPGGAFQTVSGGTTVVGVAGNGVGASGIVLTNVSGDLSFTDLDVFADGGAGVRASGTTPYTGSAGFQIAVGAGVSTIAAVGGPAVDLTTVRALLPFQQLTSTNSPTTGVALNSLLGSFSTGSSSSISNITSAAGTAFQVGSSNATISYAGTINTTTGKGVDLTSNTGSTIGFTGTLTLSTGSNTGFNATGGGTVTATDTASTLTSTTGTALNVANTTIGAGGLVFRSISANGGANGIVLNTTGSTGGLTVSGTGSAGSGGTIRNMVGADGGVAGNGVYLSSTSNVSLSWMQLNDFQSFAIRGIGVTGFTLASSVINGTNGNNAAADEGSISFSELTGSASVTSTSISGGWEDNFRVVNTSGTLNRITFSSVTIGPNSTTDGNDGILLEAQSGATVNVTVQNSTFTSARGDLFQLNHIGTSPCDLVFTGNTLTNNHPAIATGGGGVTIGGSGTGNLTYVISGNSFRDSDGHAVLLVKSTSTASYTGSFSSNSIGVAGVADSGSKAGSGLKVQNAGGGEMRISATNNQIRQYNNFGIELLTGGSATPQGGQLNATVTGNTISNPGTGGLPMNGIHLNGGTVVGDTYAICTSIGGVGGLANSVTGSGANGGTDIRLRQRQATTVRLPGYGGANNDNTAVQGHVAANNGLPAANVLAANTVPTGGGYTGGAPCP